MLLLQERQDASPINTSKKNKNKRRTGPRHKIHPHKIPPVQNSPGTKFKFVNYENEGFLVNFEMFSTYFSCLSDDNYYLFFLVQILYTFYFLNKI